ncbi:MAG: hypothetical protein U9Q74_03755 [Gemmatimonadota bacterium]|nr:hypothetical protein [Gemmatimonadota bacterium]
MALLAVAGCPLSDITGVTSLQGDTSQKTEIWDFIATDSKGSQQHAKVALTGCTASTCTGATLTSMSPNEWTTPFGSCRLPWHLSGQVTGDLVSFSINGTGCEGSLQGRSGASGGRLNGRFGTATTVSTGTMSWNGYTTLFSSSGTPQAFSGSATWSAYKCGAAGTPACPF